MPSKKNNSSIPSKVRSTKSFGSDKAKQADLSRLGELIEKRDMPAAQTLIDDLMKRKLTENEKARIHMDMLSTYLQVSNELSEQYLAELEDVVALIKSLKKEERAVSDELAVAKVRAKLI